MSVLSITRS